MNIMARRFLGIVSVGMALFMPFGCDLFTPAEISKQIEIPDIDTLVYQLRLMENDVEIKGDAEQSFFTNEGKVLLMNGSHVEAYQYENSAAVEIDAENARNSLIIYADQPHFFKSEFLIVFYVGKNMRVILPLRKIFGDEFWMQ